MNDATAETWSAFTVVHQVSVNTLSVRTVPFTAPAEGFCADARLRGRLLRRP
jgi:hypothetical protein